jgi:hypothetical protein
VIGVIAGQACFWACTWRKPRFNDDDSLDVFGVYGGGGMTGMLLATLCATALIGGAPGVLKANPQFLLLRLSEDRGDLGLVLAGSLSFCSNGLAPLDPSTFCGSRSSEASIFRSMARLCCRFPLPEHLSLPSSWAENYVGSLSCLACGPICLAFGRDPLARFQATPANSEKVHIHSPLGKLIDLARHLNSSAEAVPA